MNRAMFACLALFVAVAPCAHAQVVSDPPPANHLVSFEMIHPNFKDAEGVSLLSGAYFVGGRFSLRPNLLLIAELPYSVFRVSGAEEEAANSSAVGNPYLGIAATRQNLRFEGGVRVPVAGTEFSSMAGVVSDLMRFEAFIPDLMTVRGSVAYLAGTDAVDGQLSLSPAVLIPTGDDDAETELILDYGARVALQQNQLRLVGGLDGRAFLTEDGSFSERTAHQLLAAASYGFGRFRPGLHVRTVLDEDWSDEVNVAFGVSLEVLLGPLPVRTARR